MASPRVSGMFTASISESTPGRATPLSALKICSSTGHTGSGATGVVDHTALHHAFTAASCSPGSSPRRKLSRSPAATPQERSDVGIAWVSHPHCHPQHAHAKAAASMTAACTQPKWHCKRAHGLGQHSRAPHATGRRVRKRARAGVGLASLPQKDCLVRRLLDSKLDLGEEMPSF